MTEQPDKKSAKPSVSVEQIKEFHPGDLNDLCDATDAAIKSGGGFGWVSLPARDILERYWKGVITMPSRTLLAARLDGVIGGTCQLVKPPSNNEAQSHIVHLTTTFVAPWARSYGLGKMLVQAAENTARKEGFSVINLDVRDTMAEAINLYERLGYHRYATHPFYAKIDDEMIPGHYYYKVL